MLLEGRGVLRVWGDDRLKFLNNNLSQELENLRAGASAEALLLDPHGHIEQVIHVLDDGEANWLITAAGAAEALAAFLERMVFRSKVEFENVTSNFEVWGHFGAKLTAAESNGVALSFRDPWPEVVAGGVRYAAESAGEWRYQESLLPAGSSLSSDVKQAGTLALEALRVAAHRPDQATEVDAKALPHEFDWLTTAVHLKKGCYRGQETVAKVHNLGHPPRRLVFLHLDGSEVELPAHGAEVFVAGTEAARGHITSVGNHYEAGPIALALIARGVDETALLEVASDSASAGRIAATQEVIVPASAGKAVDLSPLRTGLLGKR